VTARAVAAPLSAPSRSVLVAVLLFPRDERTDERKEGERGGKFRRTQERFLNLKNWRAMKADLGV